MNQLRANQLAAAYYCNRTWVMWLFSRNDNPMSGALLIIALSTLGCHHFLPKIGPPPVVTVPVSNPAHIGNVDPTFLWQQVVDTVDDHFRIATEQTVQRDNNIWLEGRLKSYPEVSGTAFEPWRRDTTRGFERLQSTFETIRRTATVRVIPEVSGYMIDVAVLKEQEDIDQSQYATAGATVQRHDGTIIRNDSQVRQAPITLGWYEVGRDRELEQRIMENILGRVTNVEPPKHQRVER
jgi:hypothetical protein